MGLSQADVSQGPTAALIGQCPHVEVVMDGVEMTGLLDTGSKTTLIQNCVFVKHFLEYELPSVIKLKAANGLRIPCLGCIIMDFEIEGHKINQQGVFVVEDLS